MLIFLVFCWCFMLLCFKIGGSGIELVAGFYDGIVDSGRGLNDTN
jgi:hypothetical protein